MTEQTTVQGIHVSQKAREHIRAFQDVPGAQIVENLLHGAR